MTGKQYDESINKATTFEDALGFALSIVNPMMFGGQGNSLLMLVTKEVKDIDGDFTKREIKICTFESFYKAVLLLHSTLILFRASTNKDNTFTKKTSEIHFQIINEIINLEREVGTSGHYDFKEKDKYLNIWKKLLKNIIHLCYQYSKNRDSSQNNVNNKNFLPKLRHFLKISLSWLKKLLFTEISIKRQRDSATEDDTSNQPQSPPSENKSSRDMIRIAITVIVLVIGITLALTVFR
ncbi:hypothetical protein [Microcoleus sp. herbarium14]|uniref:hypothetical protein n=1 Tax=Microcoleus sp. herbarium14 TaxID=3055439 RepID=UPI002FCE9978